MNDVDQVMDAATVYEEGGVVETIAGDALGQALTTHARRAVEKGLYPPMFYAVLHWFPILGTTLTMMMIADNPQGRVLLHQRLGRYAFVIACMVEFFYLWVIAIFLFPPIIMPQLFVKFWLSKVFYEIVSATQQETLHAQPS